MSFGHVITVPTDGQALCAPALAVAVGQSRAIEHSVTPAELDAHIRDLGRLMTKAHADGERDVAVQMQSAMYDAIRSRSAQHQAEMLARIDARIDDACYFSSDAAHRLTGGVRG